MSYDAVDFIEARQVFNYWPEWKNYQVAIEPFDEDGWKVDRFTFTADKLGPFGGVSGDEWMLGRSICPGTYTRLSHNGTTWMTDTPAEIADHRDAFHVMEREGVESVLITGLGIGMVLQAAIRAGVPTITVVEKEAGLVRSVGTRYLDMAREHDVNLMLVVADAYTWDPTDGVQGDLVPEYDFAWHDIWPSISTDNIFRYCDLVEHYAKWVKLSDAWAIQEAQDMIERWGGWYSTDEDELQYLSDLVYEMGYGASTPDQVRDQLAVMGVNDDDE